MLLKTAVIEKRLYDSNKLVLSVTCITKKNVTHAATP